ncbi:Pro-Pol polyprotein [Araneus ventricosus]|uniref:RNA-directed DNA polymerase n=1 Tax=Araneus ventricosus TaxID=182803 RepID=A0A4Y2MMK1_ARAVE|nr:Pro-Pol polyprotein [Araneus ventricosus]GBN28375.1 Pro-Pol polyprotein [Araneus ventricosus]
MGARKTVVRVRNSFYWVGMSRDIKAFCQQCKHCQLRRRINCKDRVPITPVARPELPFQVVNIDIIGPIDPTSAKSHRYVLCLVDQHTRWAEALSLTTLTAKATCEALLTIFMRTGVPNVIASDNGTNFNASLTQEFENRMGSSPKFSTPLHPESNGLVERFNQKLKKMLHHVILEEPRSWHTKIPFVLWAYREVPNSTTGDKVIVLIPDSKNKLLVRWQGPCTIEARRNEHSFVVKMPDASVRHVHQNKMREFVASSGSVNVIFEGEEEFGDVESTPLIEDSFCQEIKS